MSFELRDHPADVAVAARSETLDGVFAAVADGMAAAMCDDIPAGGERFDVTVTAEGLEALLFDYLDGLIYERDVRSVLPVDNTAHVRRPSSASDSATVERGAISSTGPTAETPEQPYRVEASARGVPLSGVDARDLKAVTYSEMALEETPDGWRAYVVFDV